MFVLGEGDVCKACRHRSFSQQECFTKFGVRPKGNIVIFRYSLLTKAEHLPDHVPADTGKYYLCLPELCKSQYRRSQIFAE